MLNGLFRRKVNFEEKEKPDMKESTWSGILNEYLQYSQDYATNPDELISVKGWDYV